MTSEFKTIQMHKIIFFLIFFDMLFMKNIDLPLLPSMPLSLPVVILVSFLNPQIVVGNKNFKLYLLLCITMLISMFYGIFFKPPEVLLGNMMISSAEYNIKRTLQILATFFYFFYVSKYSFFPKIFKYMLLAFVLWFMTFAIISVIDLSLFFNMFNSIYGSTSSKVDYYLAYEEQNVFRYKYIFLDANTSIYFFQIVTFYLIVNEKLGQYTKIAVHLSIVLSILIAQSTGATLSALMFYSFFLFSKKVKRKSEIKITRDYYYKLFKMFLLGAILVSSFYFLINLIEKDDTELEDLEAGYSRITNNTDGGRLEKYVYMYEDRLPYIIGEGYVLNREGEYFRPHSDILRMLYSYGIIAFFTFFLIFKPAFYNKKYIFMIPAIWAFGINSLLDDPKILGILLILFAYTNNKIEKARET